VAAEAVHRFLVAQGWLDGCGGARDCDTGVAPYLPIWIGTLVSIPAPLWIL
jgi:hypothetical protein